MAATALSRFLSMRLKVEGYNQTRLIKTLTDSGITLKRVKKIKNNCMKITIKTSDKRKTFAILEKLCYNYCVEWDFSIKSCFTNALLRSGLAVGFAVGIAFISLLSGVAAFIKINGVSSEHSAEIVAGIKQKIRFPELKTDRLCEQVKSAVMESGRVADCNVYIRGNYVIVDALPVIEHSESQNRSEIVSVCDAVVTRVAVLKGTATVKVGDVVKKGQTLVSPLVYGSTGESVTLSEPPEAIIYGEVVDRYSKTVAETQSVKRYTGKTHAENHLLLPWQRVPRINPFAHFDKKVSVSGLSTVFPLRYVSVVYSEVEYAEIQVDVADEADRMLLEAKAENPYEIKSARYDVIDLGGGIKKISVYIVRERIISE